MPVPIDVMTALNALKKPDKLEGVEIPDFLKNERKKCKIYNSLGKRYTNENKLHYVKEIPELYLAYL